MKKSLRALFTLLGIVGLVAFTTSDSAVSAISSKMKVQEDSFAGSPNGTQDLVPG